MVPVELESVSMYILLPRFFANNLPLLSYIVSPGTTVDQGTTYNGPFEIIPLAYQIYLAPPILVPILPLNLSHGEQGGKDCKV